MTNSNKTIAQLLNGDQITTYEINKQYYLFIELLDVIPNETPTALIELHTHDTTGGQDTYIKTLQHNNLNDTIAEVLTELNGTAKSTGETKPQHAQAQKMGSGKTPNQNPDNFAHVVKNVVKWGILGFYIIGLIILLIYLKQYLFI